MIRVGIIGLGYWGPNILRNFRAVEGAEVVRVSDLNEEVLKKMRKRYRSIEMTTDTRAITHANDIDLVAVITPVHTHYELAKEALLQGKHVLVEKPMTATSDQAKELIEIAHSKNLTCAVDHTFIFTPAVKKIREIIDSGELGKINYYDSIRVNLGLFHTDVNVIWDLAAHDFSIMNFLMNERPHSVATHAMAHQGHKKENTAYVTLFFDSMIAHFSVNWLSPVKVRMTTIGGQKSMLVWNDLSPDEKIKLYDKGVIVDDSEWVNKQLVNYRLGDVHLPNLGTTEALTTEIEHLLDCIQKGKTALNSAEEGLEVVQLLEACDRSLEKGGEVVKL